MKRSNLLRNCIICLIMFCSLCSIVSSASVGLVFPTEGFEPPAPGKNGAFGSPWFGGKTHNGVDVNWGNTNKLPVCAIADGRVRYAGSFGKTENGKDWGNAVFVEHSTPNGPMVAVYGHIIIDGAIGGVGYGKDGPLVKQNQVLGYIDPDLTGSKPHLHFGLFLGKFEDFPRQDWGGMPPNDFPGGWVDPSLYLSDRHNDAPFIVVDSYPKQDAKGTFPLDVVPMIQFNQPIDPATMDRAITITPPLLADAAGGRLPGGVRKELSSDQKQVRLRDGRFTPGVTYTIHVSQDLKSQNGSSLSEPRQFTFTIAKQPSVTTPSGPDLSGRWEGEATDLESGTKYTDKVTIMQVKDRIYLVKRRFCVNNGNFIVTQHDIGIGPYLGRDEEDPQAIHRTLEKKGDWTSATHTERSVSKDGDRIDEESEFPDGTHQKGFMVRVDRLRAIHEITNVESRFKGLVRLNEEVLAGRMTVAEGKRYLLIFLNYPGSKLTLQAIAPDGTVFDADGPNVVYKADEIPARMYILNPTPGEWSFKVKGVEVEGDAEPFWVLTTYADNGPLDAPFVVGGAGATTDNSNVLIYGGFSLAFLLGICLVLLAVLLRKRRTLVMAGRRGGWPGAQPPAGPVYVAGPQSPVGAVQVRGAIWGRLAPQQGGEMHDLSKSKVSIGRAMDNDLVIEDSSISSHHAIIEYDNHVVLQDLDSKNGTRINGKLIKRARLHRGSRVSFGNADYVYLRDI